MRFAIIENGKVANVAESETALADNWIQSDTCSVGDRYIDGQIVKYDYKQDPEATENQKVIVRGMRNQFLSESDWTQLADSSANKQAWATYRQALRDVPTQEGFPWDIQWPTQP